MQQRDKTCWGEGDYDHRANRERGASISYATHSPPLVVRHARDGRSDASRVRPRRRGGLW